MAGGPRRLCLRDEEGQSLVEVALMIPIFTILVCYAVDFGFFFLVATSLNSAARNAMEYSIQGTSSPAQAAEPAARRGLQSCHCQHRAFRRLNRHRLCSGMFECRGREHVAITLPNAQPPAPAQARSPARRY